MAWLQRCTAATVYQDGCCPVVLPEARTKWRRVENRASGVEIIHSDRVGQISTCRPKVFCLTTEDQPPIMLRTDAQRQDSDPVNKRTHESVFASFLNTSPGGLPLSRRDKMMRAAAVLVITNAGLSPHLAGLRTAGCIRWSRWPRVGPSAAAVWPRQCRRGRRSCPAAECPTGGRSCAVGTRL